MMNINTTLHFTSTARQGLSLAEREAELEQSSSITPRHLLIGLAQLSISESTAAHVLNGLGITREKLAADQGQSPTINTLQPALSDAVKRMVERAVTVAQRRKESVLASAHLLAGILDDPDAVHILGSLDVSKDRIRTALDSLQIWIHEP